MLLWNVHIDRYKTIHVHVYSVVCNYITLVYIMFAYNNISSSLLWHLKVHVNQTNSEEYKVFAFRRL